MMIGSVGHDLIDVGDAIRSSTIRSKRGYLNLFESGAITMGCDPLQKFQRGIRAFHGETHRTAGQEMRQKVSFCRIGAINRVGRRATIDTGLTEKVL
jgi:hypothetical protein